MKSNNDNTPGTVMTQNFARFKHVVSALIFCGASSVLAQNADAPPRPEAQRPPPANNGPRPSGPDFAGPPPDAFGRGGPGGPDGRGPGGFGGMPPQKTELVKQFDKDGNGRLDVAERKAAREFLQKERIQGRGGRRGGPGFGGPGGFRGRGENQEAPQPGPKLSPSDVKSFSDAPLYDPLTLRTFFLEFASIR